MARTAPSTLRRRPAGSAAPATAPGAPDEDEALRATVERVLCRWPSTGLAVAVVRDGRPVWFHEHGVGNVETGEPVTRETVFRIGSLTKTITAVAVLQLWERGQLDLDAPANEYLTTFTIRTARPDLQPATIRHLLTHTGGVGYWRRLPDLLRPAVGSGTRARRLVPLQDYYRGGLLQEIQPGTKWVYSNHGFAALGQVVEDVTGRTLADYLRENVFDPLGMEHTDLVRSSRVRPRLATGHVLRSRGPVPVADGEIPTPGGGGVYSTSEDLARYAACLLHEGRGEHGRLLEPATVNMMFEPHYQPEPRLPGAGLGFHLSVEHGHQVVAKDGVVSGFLADLALLPSEGIGVLALTNTGGLNAQGAAVPVGGALLRQVLDLPEDPVRHDLPPRAEVWPELCGWYAPPPGPLTNLFPRVVMGAGAEVVVERRQLVLKPISPVPALRRGWPLVPDDRDDPYVFRVDLSEGGMPSLPALFTGHGPGQEIDRFWLDLMPFDRRPDGRNPRRLAQEVLAAGAVGLAIRRLRGGARGRTPRWE